SVSPVIIIRSAATNESGIAYISFRIPTPVVDGEPIIIGEWFAIATVDIAGVVVNDTLTFRVDYGAKITNVMTLNQDLLPKTRFLRLETIFFDITVENTGLTSKTTTISIDVHDSSKTPIIHAELQTILNPGQNRFQLPSQIPSNSKVGEAKVYVTAYTAPPSENGVPYGPTATTEFFIISRDIAVDYIEISSYQVKSGDIVEITAYVRNNGNETESFYVSAFYNQTLITKNYVSNLQPSAKTSIKFYWDTTGIQEGVYVITCIADPVEGEIETQNNILKDGAVIVMPSLPIIIHDVAIVNVTIHPREAEIGQTIKILIQVKNLGQEPESFNLSLYYGGFNLATLQVSFLPPGETLNLPYFWDTSNVMEGNYTIKAVIPQLIGEENIANNQFIGGNVWIKAPQIAPKKHDIAVTGLTLSKAQAYKDENVAITVQVQNFGDFNETFLLSVYANKTMIGSYTVKDLKARSGKLFDFILETAKLDVGNYIIWAKAEYVAGETNVENNIFIGETLTILKPTITYIHDIAIINVQPSSDYAFIGQELKITIIVKNLGNATENFNLTVYYDASVLERLLVSMLHPGAEKKIELTWDTSGMSEGNYRLRAYAEPVLGEVNIANNVFEDGIVTIRKPPPTVSLFLLILPILILLIIILVVIILYYLWKKKKTLTLKPQIIVLSKPRL
ncbi:hypothetical protein KEJ32_00700, partial [Candidatus Bathyarchaeota archaeon]|nr:hypothetical protein [Candidatus Bathyarchaeota archaeon]